MKLVVTCQPAVGHFHAVAQLARAAVDAGHEVVVATGRGMGHWVTRAGFAVREVGPAWLADGPRAGAFDDPRRRLRLMSLATGSMVAGLVDLLRELRPDVVLHESLEWAAPLAADAAGVPYAALGQLPRLPRPVLAEVMAEPWNAARRRLGLPADPGLERLYPYLYLDAYLPSWQPLTANPLSWFDGPAEPDVAHLIQPPLYQVGDEVPAWLAALPDRPVVYVTMGTAFNQVGPLFATVAEALRDEDVSVVMTVGSGVDPAPLAALGPNIHAARYIPQEAVLSRSAAVVQHAGYLTTVGALRHGLPMVAIPVAVDQPYHAHRLAAAGAAVRLDHRTLDPARVRAAVRAVLDEPLYRANAERLRREMLAMPPTGHGVTLLERLAASGRPVFDGADELAAVR
ncbi:glycosyltransferase, MGT family [Micromonospora echinaurantiaca]|uniref:Glycosyltransferase, MGT family n=1 Tax=Micromonospora echinaurantiaca TaxID=47857 RepID=A0A1C5HM32_9ACTN|nr:glycosyltransferase [Micromonospora echinaurantiaca]SCG46631.1 glycosyltransferase, MGT family [Micromonospora echinaurantiaca]